MGGKGGKKKKEKGKKGKEFRFLEAGFLLGKGYEHGLTYALQ
jgi:hypothetical protein